MLSAVKSEFGASSNTKEPHKTSQLTTNWVGPWYPAEGQFMVYIAEFVLLVEFVTEYEFVA